MVANMKDKCGRDGATDALRQSSISTALYPHCCMTVHCTLARWDEWCALESVLFDSKVAGFESPDSPGAAPATTLPEHAALTRPRRNNIVFLRTVRVPCWCGTFLGCLALTGALYIVTHHLSFAAAATFSNFHSVQCHSTVTQQLLRITFTLQCIFRPSCS